MQLSIISKGHIDPAAFSLLGHSTARGTDAIGQFGSGAKHALLIALRNSLPFTVHSGLEEIPVGKKEKTAFGNQVEIMTVDGHETSMSISFGELDWKTHTSISGEVISEEYLMLRELISNALDQGTPWEDIIQFGPYVPKEGQSAIHFPTAGIAPVTEVISRFLHSKGEEKLSLLPQEQSPCKFYRKGVYICTFPFSSLFSFNDRSGVTKVDESRQMSSNPTTVITQIIEADESTWETFYRYFLTFPEGLKSFHPTYDSKLRDFIQVSLKRDFDNYIEDNSSFAHKAGPRTCITPGFRGIFAALLPCLTESMSFAAKLNAEFLTATREEINLFNRMNQLIRAATCTELPTPTLNIVRSVDDSLMGEYSEGKVFINKRYATNPDVYLEELIHHYFAAADFTREFQNGAISLVTYLLDKA